MIVETCTPTHFLFTPEWMPTDGKGVVLEYEFVTAGGAIQAGQIKYSASQMSDTMWFGPHWTPAQALAKTLLFYSGLDLFRQAHGEIGDSFDVSYANFTQAPLEDMYHQQVPLIPMGISGLTSSDGYPNELSAELNTDGLYNVGSTLTLKVAADVPADFEDWVLNTFGHDVVLHSCARRFNNNQ